MRTLPPWALSSRWCTRRAARRHLTVTFNAAAPEHRLRCSYLPPALLTSSHVAPCFWGFQLSDQPEDQLTDQCLCVDVGVALRTMSQDQWSSSNPATPPASVLAPSSRLTHSCSSALPLFLFASWISKQLVNDVLSGKICACWCPRDVSFNLIVFHTPFFAVFHHTIMPSTIVFRDTDLGTLKKTWSLTGHLNKITRKI